MPPIALDKIIDFDYVLESERDKPNKTIFRLRPLTSIEMMEVTEIKATIGQTAARLRALFYGLRGWQDFLDGNGKPVEFSGLLDQNLSRLTVENIVELAAEIIVTSKVQEKDRKN